MIFKNNTPDLTLASSIGVADNSVVVNENVSWVTPPMTFVIDPGGAAEEAVYVTAVDSSTKTLTVIRGADGYAAQSHAAGAVMRHMVLAERLREAKQYVNWRIGGNEKQRVPVHVSVIAQGAITPEQNRVYTVPDYYDRPVTIDTIGVYCSTAGSSDGSTYIGIYNSDPVTLLPKSLLASGGPIVLNIVGEHNITFNLAINPGIYWYALLNTGYTTAPVVWGNNTSGVPLHVGFAMTPSDFRTPFCSPTRNNRTTLPNPFVLDNGGGDRGMILFRIKLL